MADEKYIESLVELVRQRDVLWRKSHSGYKDSRLAKYNNWKDIASELTSMYPNIVFSGKYSTY